MFANAVSDADKKLLSPRWAHWLSLREQQNQSIHIAHSIHDWQVCLSFWAGSWIFLQTWS